MFIADRERRFLFRTSGSTGIFLVETSLIISWFIQHISFYGHWTFICLPRTYLTFIQPLTTHVVSVYLDTNNKR